MINRKLPLFKRGDVLRNDELGFDWIVKNCYENDDGTFEYEVYHGLTSYVTEDELFSEFTLLEG